MIVATGAEPAAGARVLAAAAGNPLALVELARSLPPEAGTQSFPALPLTERLERAFTARLDELPPHTRACLLAAALDGRASLDELIRCAATVAGSVVSVSAVDPAVEVGLVEVDAQELRFRHPLIRSALRQKATVAQRIATYAALAEVVADPERKLWHRAMAAVGCDEDLAADLEDHAEAARRRGAMTVAAPTLERAAALTAEPRRKGKRRVRAAEVAVTRQFVGLPAAKKSLEDVMNADTHAQIMAEGIKQEKIGRAMLAGPSCVPGDQNIVGAADMCADPMGMVWLKDLMARKPAPTVTGGYFYHQKPRMAHPVARDLKVQDQLLTYCAALTGVTL